MTVSNLSRRRIHQREGLPTSSPREDLSAHIHCSSKFQDYTLFAGTPETIATLPYTATGQILPIEFQYTQYVYKVELLITSSFTAAFNNTFTTKILFCCPVSPSLSPLEIEVIGDTATTHALTTYDISEEFAKYYDFVKDWDGFTDENLNLTLSVKVSDVTVPVDIYGVTMRLHSIVLDDFGEKSCSQEKFWLDCPHNLNQKEYWLNKLIEIKKRTYLSGLPLIWK